MSLIPTSNLTVLVDIGGTLLKREKPGANQRVKKWLSENGKSPNNAKVQIEISKAILTARDENSIISYLKNIQVNTYGNLPEKANADEGEEIRAYFTDDDVKEIYKLVREHEGEIILLPFAIEFLRKLNSLGCKIIAVSNVNIFSSDIPDEISKYFHAIINSCSIGFIKEERNFWVKMIDHLKLNIHTTIVVGDNIEADVNTPKKVGILGLQTTSGKLSLQYILDSTRKCIGWINIPKHLVRCLVI